MDNEYYFKLKNEEKSADNEEKSADFVLVDCISDVVLEAQNYQPDITEIYEGGES